jgi:hypothetical protein
MNDLRVSFPKPCSERWDDMRPQGCNRFCEQCDKTIHDLSQLILEDAEQLARSDGEICVRAEVGPGGLVRLKSSRSARRMVATIGASVGILTASGQAAAADEPKLGAIKGAVLASCGWGGSVSATAADGRVFHAKIGMNNRYKVKRLPPGSYQVKVDAAEPEASNAVTDQIATQPPSARQVVVEAGRTSVLDLPDPTGCIIVGVMSIDHSNG